MMDAGTFLRYKLSEYKKEMTAVSAGLWYRFNDALVLVARLEYNRYTVGLSYDTNVSSLAKASRLRAGPEVSVIYTGNFPSKWKQNRVRTKTYCPRF